MLNRLIAVLLLVLVAAGCSTGPTVVSPEVVRALAPTGQLRLGFQANNAHATKDPVSGELRGPAIDFGRELARRLGVELKPVQYAVVGDLIASFSKKEADVLSIGINPERERLMKFSQAYTQIESGYLVRKGSRITTIDSVDQPNTRIAVLQRGDSDVLLSKTLKSAELVRTRTFAEALDLLKTGKVDAMAFLKTGLYPVLEEYSEARLLDGRIQVQELAFAVDNNNETGANYVRQLVSELKASGFVGESLKRAGVKGLSPAP